MPAKNTVRYHTVDAYFHVYNRGAFKQVVFRDEQDYWMFLHLLKRYLGNKSSQDTQRHRYPTLKDEVELLAFCLMSNHFHLLLYQKSEDGITNLMRRLTASYTSYFRERHGHAGTLFQGKYKAALITDNAYLWHISRYIHLNPTELMQGRYHDYAYSSYTYYMGTRRADWIHPEKILELTGSQQSYANFIADYTDYQKTLKAVEQELASA